MGSFGASVRLGSVAGAIAFGCASAPEPAPPPDSLQAQLQREVVILEAGDLSYDREHPERNPDIKRMNDLRRERLAAARQELEQARRELSHIEEGAQRDGVAVGELR